MSNLKNFPTNLVNYPPSDYHNFIQNHIGDDGVDLIKKMLVYDPSKRISAVDALKHKYF